MGAAFSANYVSTDQILTVINQITLNNLAVCSGDSTITQNVNFSGSNNLIQDALITQSVDASLNCVSTVDNQTKLITDMAAELTNKINNENGLVLGLSFQASLIEQNVVEQLLQSQVVNTIQKCSLGTTFEQNVNFGGSYNQIIGATISQDGNLFIKCVFGASNVTEMTNSLQSTINNEIKNTAGIKVGALTWIYLIIGVVIIVVIIVIVIRIIRNNLGRERSNPRDVDTAIGVMKQSNGKI